jgi:hypothetical protein
MAANERLSQCRPNDAQVQRSTVEERVGGNQAATTDRANRPDRTTGAISE